MFEAPNSPFRNTTRDPHPRAFLCILAGRQPGFLAGAGAVDGARPVRPRPWCPVRRAAADGGRAAAGAHRHCHGRHHGSQVTRRRSTAQARLRGSGRPYLPLPNSMQRRTSEEEAGLTWTEQRTGHPCHGLLMAQVFIRSMRRLHQRWNLGSGLWRVSGSITHFAEPTVLRVYALVCRSCGPSREPAPKCVPGNEAKSGRHQTAPAGCSWMLPA